MLVRTETTDDEKHSDQQLVTSLLMAHRPIQCVSKSKSKAMKELRTYKQIIILPADKGRSNVVMNQDYNEKSEALLDGGEFYRPAQRAQAKAVSDRLNELLRAFKRQNVITDNERRQMKPTDTASGRFYGMSKIHKPNVLLRTIVTLKCSLTYNLEKCMYSKLKFLQNNSTASVRLASQFLSDLQGRRIQ
uniref:Uncharacterized protein n=1 Tax=Schistocephalus solidus TaxID=70667 RepID=A0A0V0J7J1_SCHSO